MENEHKICYQFSSAITNLALALNLLIYHSTILKFWGELGLGGGNPRVPPLSMKPCTVAKTLASEAKHCTHFKISITGPLFLLKLGVGLASSRSHASGGKSAISTYCRFLILGCPPGIAGQLRGRGSVSCIYNHSTKGQGTLAVSMEKRNTAISHTLNTLGWLGGSILAII